MKTQEFKKNIYNNVSDYWNVDDNDEKTEYSVVNIILGLPEILKFIKFNKYGLSSVHIEYLEYFYDFVFPKKQLPSLTEEEQKIFVNTKRDENVQSQIVEKIKIRAKIRDKQREVGDKLNQIEDDLRICAYQNIAKKNGINNLEDKDVKKYLFVKKIITKQNENILEKYMKDKILEKYPEREKILEECETTKETISKQIKELTKKRFVKITITKEIKNKRRKIEEKYLKILFKYLKSRKLLSEFLKEIRKDYKNYDHQRISSFYTPPIKEAKDRMIGELPLAKHNIIATGYYPFTIIKIEGNDEDEIKEIEINWWIKFLKSGKEVWNDGLQKKGFDFLKKIDLYNNT